MQDGCSGTDQPNFGIMSIFHSIERGPLREQKTGGTPRVSPKTGKSFFSTRNSSIYAFFFAEIAQWIF